jgi:hypothetical protein
MEAAQALARRLMTAAPGSPAERIRIGYRLCLSRSPSNDELERLVAFHTQSLRRFQSDAARARDVATKPLGDAPAGADLADLAATTMVGNVLLNLDETLMKR